MYQPLVSQTVNGLQRGWKEQISGKEFGTDDPKQENEMLRQASAYSVTMQHVMDRTLRTVEAIETGLSLPTHRFRNMTLVDRQTLYASDNENLDAAVEAALANE
ncbi:hypothetical protein [Lacipirellula sp.]|uniref:hypothetical protein n=1 Tax=Lacipirellula sp. TaxID=2691419 RepID=UPI003D0D9FD3